jgi:hypothetical protein
MKLRMISTSVSAFNWELRLQHRAGGGVQRQSGQEAAAGRGLGKQDSAAASTLDQTSSAVPDFLHRPQEHD